ncbi:MAG: rRNA maturation RNase YbeY [Desulfobacterales bacterium]|nr:rRNA maturation RNase YbeY [Desulfobacterales bacterium]
MEVQIGNRQSIHRISKKKIRQTASVILNALGYPDAELSILIVDDQQIAQLNRQYLNREGPTNVIAFSMRQGQFSDIAPNLLGDVVISADTTHREAQSAGISMQDRFDQLLIHGTLHLLGYDHENTEAQARKMEKKNNELLKLLE